MKTIPNDGTLQYIAFTFHGNLTAADLAQIAEKIICVIVVNGAEQLRAPLSYATASGPKLQRLTMRPAPHAPIRLRAGDEMDARLENPDHIEMISSEGEGLTIECEMCVTGDINVGAPAAGSAAPRPDPLLAYIGGALDLPSIWKMLARHRNN